MDSTILQLMESTNPQDRKKAIKMLAQVGGQEALRYIGTIYKQDSDPEVKELAIQAGRFIKKQQDGGGSAPQPAPVAEASVVEPVEEPEEVEAEYQPIVVSAGKQEQARGMMDRALDLSMQGEKDKAIESMSKAFKINPNLQLDTYYMGVAMDVTGLDKKSTVQILTSDEKSRKAKDKVKNKEKLKNDGSGGDDKEVTWETVLIDLALYYTVIAGIVIVSMVLIIQAVTSGMASLPRTAQNAQMIQSLQIFNNVGIVASVLYGLIAAAFNVGILVIFFGVMHMIATMMFGGEGTYRGLIHRGAMPLIVSNAVGGAIALLTIYVSIRQILTPAMLNSTTNTTQTFAAFNNPIFSILNLVSFAVSIGCMVWFVNRIGENYEFGWGRGCLTYLVSLIGILVGFCGCYFFVLSSLFNTVRR